MCSQQVWGSDPAFLCGASESVSGVLCPVWGCPVQERAGCTGASPCRATKMVRGVAMVFNDCDRKKTIYGSRRSCIDSRTELAVLKLEQAFYSNKACLYVCTLFDF